MTANIDPEEYFKLIKEEKKKITDEELVAIYNNCLELFEKYKKTGQVKGMNKLLFHLKNIEKEREILKLGINQFVYRETIEDYIENVSDEVVKVIELKDYEREVPDEIADLVEKTNKYFTNFYVLFTDYTGKTERRVAREKRRKDPILFGSFVDQASNSVLERFYYLGDWVDEYCDLTLDKFVNKYKEKKGENPKVEIKTPVSINELEEQLNRMASEKNGLFRISERKPKKHFFEKIRNFFTRKKTND